MYNRMLELLTEIGDTNAGMRRIFQAYTTRRKQVEKAKEAMGTNLNQFGKNSVSDTDTAKVIRGELQLSKVKAYAVGRLSHEGASSMVSDDPELDTLRGDAGAKEKIKAYNKVHKGSENDIRREFKGKLGTKGEGVKAATRNIRQTGQFLNYRNN